MKTCIFAIDPQRDFTVPRNDGQGLYTPGAEHDMKRLSEMIKRHLVEIDGIEVTLDSHHYVHIAHECSWVDKHGNHPAPFTVITAAMVDAGDYRAYNPGFQEWYVDYVRKLEENKRYALTIWPYHCLIGSEGTALNSHFYDAMLDWEKQYAVANKTTKGSNLFTEHYSVVKADVERDDDPHTKLNTRLINVLKEYDRILIAGEAMTHCVMASIRDVAENFTDDEIKKLVLLEDATSWIPDPPGLPGLFSDPTNKFLNDMKTKGMKTATTKTVF